MTSREFAIKVTQQLQDAGFTALWAGGCVRDRLVGKDPKDYDVATNATPDQVRDLFGKRRTLAIGASFGVITVLGPKTADPIEVATFRKDSGYSDGRRPDSIEYTDAREDAIRRDFTINGMFYDPIKEKVIDYVGGQDDLNRNIIRAIGNPHERIEEDKLRMLRAVRFAATFDFELELETLSAVKKHAAEIKVVSGERIGAELRRMLKSPNRAIAVQLLWQTSLLHEILPGAECYQQDFRRQRTVEQLARLKPECFSTATALLVEPLSRPGIVDELVKGWKLSNDEKKTIAFVLKHSSTLAKADQLKWSEVQPLLIQEEARFALDFLEARLEADTAISFCRERLKWNSEKLNPPPLMDGYKLKELGIQPGRHFGRIMKELRRMQLDGEINSLDAAADVARKLASQN